jgi:hypothetical protein
MDAKQVRKGEEVEIVNRFNVTDEIPEEVKKEKHNDNKQERIRPLTHTTQQP